MNLTMGANLESFEMERAAFLQPARDQRSEALRTDSEGRLAGFKILRLSACLSKPFGIVRDNPVHSPF